MSQGKSVLVLNAEGIFVEYVEPAVARRALSEGVAKRVKGSKSFTLQMQDGLQRLPRLFNRSSKMSKKIPLSKFDAVFAEEQPLWLKMLIPGQCSLEVPVATGVTVPIKVPSNGDPVRVTDVADFASLKRCADLRKLASPRSTTDPKTGRPGLKPPAVAILTETDMYDYLEKKALRRGWLTPEGEPDVERAMSPVYTESASPAARTSVDLPEKEPEVGQPDANLGKDGVVSVAEAVHPRVLSLMQEVGDPSVSDDQRWPEDQVLDELDGLGELSEDSLQHILAHGYYKGVKSWARRALAALTPGEDA